MMSNGSLWIEKYRPKKFEDVVGNEDVVEVLKKKVREEKNIPHLLLIGPPGVGKTTLAYVIASELGASLMEINASDERGIDVVRGKIKMFVKSGGLSQKILLLDEADFTTEEFQHALRRLMEQYSENCRFIITANYGEKIIEPLKSRCFTVYLKSLQQEHIYKIVKRVVEGEKLNLSEEQIWKIVRESGGDARKAINMLQTGVPISQIKIDFGELTNLLIESKVERARLILEEWLKYNPPHLFIKEWFEWFINNHTNLPQIFPKSDFLLLLADYEERVSRSNVPYLQLFSLLVRVAILIKTNKR